MKPKLIPDDILDNVPLTFRHIDEVAMNDLKRSSKGRLTTNTFYNTNMLDCMANYRKTSKLLRANGIK